MMGMSGRRMPGPPPSGGGGISEGESASIPLARGICAIFSPGRPSATRALLHGRIGEQRHYTIARAPADSSNEGNADTERRTCVPEGSPGCQSEKSWTRMTPNAPPSITAIPARR